MAIWHDPTSQKIRGWLVPCLTHHPTLPPPLVAMVMLKLETMQHHHIDACKRLRQITIPYDRDIVVFTTQIW
jgi:hypothetical protein